MLTNKDSQDDNEKTDSNFIKFFQNTCSCLIHYFFGGKIMKEKKEISNWGGSREGSGRKKGSETGRKKEFLSTSISGAPEEIAKLKEKALLSGKSVSRYVLDWVLSQN